MTVFERLDPEYRRLNPAIPDFVRTIPVVKRRAFFASQGATPDASPTCAVDWHDCTAPGFWGGPAVPVRVYCPSGEPRLRPGLVFIHGGGMWMGDLDSEHLSALQLAARLDAVVVSVGYRLAPESPYPAAVEDCHAGLIWTWESAPDWGIDPFNIGIHGGSAGGGLAIATALRNRDMGEVPVSFLAASYPMIDDRHTTPSSIEFDDLGGLEWDRTLSLEAWSWYLSGKEADEYAAPSRATNLRGLPPTFIDVGELDPFRDEDVEFALRLMQAGVPTELHVYPGAFHASELAAPEAALSKRILETRIAAIRRGMDARRRME